MRLVRWTGRGQRRRLRWYCVSQIPIFQIRPSAGVWTIITSGKGQSGHRTHGGITVTSFFPDTPLKDMDGVALAINKQHRPRQDMVSGELVRARSKVLPTTAGMTPAEISGLCGMRSSALDHAVYRRNVRPPAKFLASMLAALNAIRYRDIIVIEPRAGWKVSGDASRLQIQALYSQGWRSGSIRLRAGSGYGNRRGRHVLAKVLVAAADTYSLSGYFYDSLWLQGSPVPPPPGYGLAFFTGRWCWWKQ